MHNILIIDDEKDIREIIGEILEDEGYSVRKAVNSDETFSFIENQTPDVMILDIWLQKSKLDGLEILRIVKKNYPNLPIIMISGHGNIETAVDSIKMGAYDYIEKPFNEERFVSMVKRACVIADLHNENSELKSQINLMPEFIARSEIMQEVSSKIDKIAASSSRILIFGETGTGKSTIAKIIHENSSRSNRSLVEFSASGLNSEEIEEKLFGTKETLGANFDLRKKGVLEQAANTTLYINEIADFPEIIQQKFLNFLSKNSYEVPGSNRILKLDVRIIASTKFDLTEKIKNGLFNSSLYYRLKTFAIDLPALRLRKKDIAELCKIYLQNISKSLNYSFSENALSALQFYSWPGNVRELINIMGRLYINTKDRENKEIDLTDLPVEIQHNSLKIDAALNNIEILNYDIKSAREFFEKQYIQDQLERFEGNVSKVAEFIGMERTALYRKIRSLGIETQ